MKESKKEQKRTNEMIDSLIEFAGKGIMKDKFVSACVINGNEQPIVLSTSEDGMTNQLTLDSKNTLEMPTKMIPYLAFALTKMYVKNLDEVYAGDKNKVKAHLKNIQEEIDDIEFFNLSSGSSRDGKCTCGNKSCPDYEEDKVDKTGLSSEEEIDDIEEALERIEKKAYDKINEGSMSEEEAVDLLGGLQEMLSTVKGASKEQLEGSVKAGNLGGQEFNTESALNKLEELRKEHDSKLLDQVKEIEAKLNGKVSKPKEEISLESIREVFMKHGPLAAKEELRRVPVEQREGIMKQVIELMKSR